ncbi:MAG: tRNA lysidine(34) synthetase TilS [Pseudomonadota bacterium]
MSERDPFGAEVRRDLSAEAFADRLAPLITGRKLAIGVSGGSDSLALLLLAVEARAALGLELHALTVDHGLRPESGAEARRVGEICARLSVPHAVLPWLGAKPSSNLQAAAREARYRLMRDWRQANGVPSLAVAHTQDDVAETFLLRLARGSGVDGLAAMSDQLDEGDGFYLIRPLLEASREELQAVCAARKQQWIDDPSNDDLRFDRVKARMALSQLAPLGLSRERLAKTARSMGRARRALETATSELLVEAVRAEPKLGVLRYDVERFARAPREIGLRALAAGLNWVAAALYPPRLDSLEAAFDAVLSQVEGGRTLHGCILAWERGGLTICREPAALPELSLLETGVEAVWDGALGIRAAVDGLWMGALGASGVTELHRRADEQVFALPEFWRNAPAPAREAALALWTIDEGGEQKTLQAVPILDWSVPELANGGSSAIFSVNAVGSRRAPFDADPILCG